MAELAVGHVSIVADTSRLAPDIKKALGSASGYGTSAGKTIGEKLTSGIGKTLKAGVVGVGVAAGGALAGSIAKGLGRLNSLDQASAKLEALGNSGQEVDGIMSNALASVKGTAFGIGEAAGTAATMVASGVKPGKELESVLTGVADSAAIAGVGMDDMGLIWGKVAAKGRLDGETMAQMLERQIPIYDILSEKTGIASEDIADMVSKGEIDFQTFSEAMNDYVGGGAKRMGETVQGAMDNVGAAMGRFGEALLAPAFSAAPALLSSFGGLFDKLTDAIAPASEELGKVLTPALEDFAGVIENRVAPFAGEAAAKIGDIVVSLTEKALDPATWEKFGDVFTTIKDTVAEMWPSIESLAGSFLTITQNVSVTTWQILADTLDALAPLIESVLIPLVEKVADFTENNPGVVEKIVMAFLGFKAMGAIAGPVGKAAGALGTLGGAVKGVHGAFKGASIGQGLLNIMGGAKSANPILAKLGGVVGTVFKAFWKLSPVLSGVMKVFGKGYAILGPWGVAISVIASALTYFFTQTELGQKVWQGLVDAVTGALDWIKEKFEAFTGWITDAWDGLKALFFEGDFTGALRDAFGWEEDNAFVNGVLTVRDALSGVVDMAKGIIDILFKGDFSGMPFGIEEDSGFVNFLFNVRDAVISAGDFIKKVFDGIFKVAKVTLAVIGTVILTPLLLAWQALSWGIKAAWENIIKPVWDGLSEGITWVWENVLSPTFTWIGEKWQELSDTFSRVWEIIKTAVLDAWSNYWGEVQANFDIVMGALNTAWTWLKDTFTAVWEIIKTAVLDVWEAYWSRVQANFQIVTGALNVAWTWLKDMFIAVWNTIKGLVVSAFEQAWTNLKNNFQTVVDLLNKAWTWLKDQLYATWSWIDQNVLGGFRRGMEGFRSFFEGIVDGIKRVWDGLRSALAKPINFMINTVYNGGILKAWETIRKFLPGLKEASPLASIPEHATGGRISGPGTGTSDDVLMWGSNGEHMLTAREVQRFGGHGHVYAMRKMIDIGRPFSFDGHGGITPLPRSTDNRSGDLFGAAPGILPAYKDGGEIKPLWEHQLIAAHKFAQSQHGKPYQWAGPTGPGSSFDCSGFMGSIAAVIQGTNPWQRYWATMSFPSPGAQGFAPGLGPGFSVGIFNGGPYGGHTAGTLGPAGSYGSVNVESGGAPSMVKYGIGAAGADHSQFTMRYHLPIGADGAFVSGGNGGMSPEAMQDGLKKKVSDLVDKAMNPILSRLPVGPPEWQNIPKNVYDKGKKGMLDTAFDFVGKLGDKLASAWTAAGEVKDLIADSVGNAASWVNNTVRDIVVRDNGGLVPSGAAAVNLSGKDELMLPPSTTALFNKFLKDMPGVAGALERSAVSFQAVSDELSIAYRGGDWGYGELSRYVGDEFARGMVNGVARLGKAIRSGEIDLAGLREQGRKSAEDYAAEQAGGVLGTFGLEGLVPLAQKAGQNAWEAYQASPYDVGLNGQTIVVEYVGDENDREWKMLQKLDKEVALLKAKRKPKASAMTRGGVQ